MSFAFIISGVQMSVAFIISGVPETGEIKLFQGGFVYRSFEWSYKSWSL